MKTTNVSPITTSKITISLFYTYYLTGNKLLHLTYIFKDNKNKKK